MNQFNLIDEPWIPVVGEKAASLRDIFSTNEPSQLGGTPIQKLSVLKLLLAIAQHASTPTNQMHWKELGPNGIGDHCLAYLEANHACFSLYGDRPFLQFPILEQIKTYKGEPIAIMPIGKAYHPDIPAENDTVINQYQVNRVPTDAEKALFLVSVMNYNSGGKRVAHVPPLSPHFTTKGKSAKPGPSLGNYTGYAQSCLWGSSILETVWLNLFTKEDFAKYPQWHNDPIPPPWQLMPTGEDDDIARALKNSHMGTLVSLSRFTLLKEDGVLFTEGIQYPSHKEGWREPFMSIKKDDKVQFLDTSKKPWRNLDALLSLSFAETDRGFTCTQVQEFLLRARSAVPSFGVWSGGLQVRGTAGDQSVKQSDDFIESVIFLDSKALGEPWFKTLESEMGWLESTGYTLKMSVKRYYQELNEKKASIDAAATARFWEYCETLFQNLVDACADEDALLRIRRKIAIKVDDLYNTFCGRDTARQMISWVKHRPIITRITQEEE